MWKISLKLRRNPKEKNTKTRQIFNQIFGRGLCFIFNIFNVIVDRASVATTVHVEEDFPRGGEEIITPLERRKIRHQAQQDDLFGKVRVTL